MCAKTLVVYFYLTPAKKTLPRNQGITLDSSNCNSAVTTSCTPNGEILVYRKEEWFKEKYKSLADPRYRDETRSDTFLVGDAVKAWWWKNKEHNKGESINK